MRTLETDRLILRAFDEEDISALLSIHCDEEVNRFLPWFPLKTMEDAETFFRERYAEPKERGYDYAVCMKTDNVPIGYVGVSGNHELGYGLHRDFWHQGIMTEACRAVVEQAKRDGVPFLFATHDVNNPRSGAVMRRLGMRYMYSYEEQWMPKDILVTYRLYQINLDGDEDRVFRGCWDACPVHYIEKGLEA